MQKYQPAITFHPGEYLLEEIQTRKITQTALAQIMEKPLKTINEVVNGKKSITPEIAYLLEGALDISADTWISLQKVYDLQRIKPKIETKFKNTRKRSQLFFNSNKKLLPT